MKTIKQTYLIEASVEKVWQALINPEVINKWGGGPATIAAEVDTDFKFWGGDIHGTITEVIENQKLSQDWYGGDWSAPSKVTFHLSKTPQGTKLELLHDNVPDDEIDDIDDGWKRYYLGPIKELLEKGGD